MVKSEDLHRLFDTDMRAADMRAEVKGQLELTVRRQALYLLRGYQTGETTGLRAWEDDLLS